MCKPGGLRGDRDDLRRVRVSVSLGGGRRRHGLLGVGRRGAGGHGVRVADARHEGEHTEHDGTDGQTDAADPPDVAVGVEADRHTGRETGDDAEHQRPHRHGVGELTQGEHLLVEPDLGGGDVLDAAALELDGSTEVEEAVVRDLAVGVHALAPGGVVEVDGALSVQLGIDEVDTLLDLSTPQVDLAGPSVDLGQFGVLLCLLGGGHCHDVVSSPVLGNECAQRCCCTTSKSPYREWQHYRQIVVSRMPFPNGRGY